MARQIETLARIGLFRSLIQPVIQKLDTQCIWRRVPAKEWIIDYHDESNDVFFVVSGAARVKIQALSGREALLREINAGEYFGELAAIDGQPRSSGIVAVTDVTVAQMPAAVFREVLHEHPDICDQVMTLMAQQIRNLVTRVHEFTSLDAKYRIYAELLRLSKPVAGHPDRALVSPPPAHTELAARVSIRREAVAREIKALERAGIIGRRPGALVLVDTSRLRQMIAEASEAD
ncbi:Crp/Fnr family transcriptional regulator [Rhodoplanes sp. Z2-YC6860]|uniref:Crp/Fnr family transcriptional regulator n=1 Tax=Rhodoplanes sp. Z2-YC6860 TaxID=674703 RepID=UPI00078C9252|nr:Crp/Fnr family transcriptional regulator [Rhodoplanes sp. Z2-YC6860]AMN39524.1 transcriptional regulator, Crp/Fnr family [Rhodoplanes sp. Z2-YC6860]